jgi:hypothetical protein
MLRIALTIVAVACSVLPAEGDDWPTAAHDASRSGRTSDSPAPPFRIRWAKAWQYENIATTAQLIVAEGRGFIGTLGRDGSLAGRIHCVDVRDGSDLWTFDELKGGVAHSLTWSPAEGGTVYAATTAGEVVALEAATGQLRWKFVTPLGGFVVNPCVAEGLVLLGSRQGVFYALNESDGAVRWQRVVEAPICHTAAADKGVVYFLDESIRPHALEVATGQAVAGWQGEQLHGGSARFYWPVIAGDRLLLTVAPPHQYNWAETDAVLFEAPGVKSRKEGDRFAPLDAEKHQEEQQNVIAFLTERPHNQVMHCLDRNTGKQACLPSVFYTGGSGSECTPPVVTAEGEAIVEYRSWYSEWDSDSWVNPYSAIGKLDTNTGVVAPISPRLQANRVPWGHIWIIADESSAFTVAGDRLLVAHQGNFGGVDLRSGRTFAGVGKRDTWGGFPALSWSRQEWHGGPRSGLSVAGDTAYFVVGGRVIACEGHASGGKGSVEPIVVAEPSITPLPSLETTKKPPDRSALLRACEQLTARKPADRGALSDALRQALDREVEAIVKDQPLGPFVEWRGLSPTRSSMQSPAETLYALAIAAPHLSASRREQVAGYLRSAIERGDLTAEGAIPAGRPRNFQQVDQPDAERHRAPLLPWRRADAYTLSLLAPLVADLPLNRLAEDLRRLDRGRKLDRLRQPLTTSPRMEPTAQWAEAAAYSQHLTDLVGRVRLARQRGEDPDEGDLAQFEAVFAPFLEHYRQLARSCLEHIDAVPGGKEHASVGGQYRNLGGPYLGHIHEAAIVSLSDLCPEIALLLREHAPAETEGLRRWVFRNAQGCYLARWDTPVQEGEVAAPHSVTTQNYFHLLASLSEPDEPTRQILADAPVCRGDLHYIERLVFALEAP